MLVMCRFFWPCSLSANLSVSDFATVSAVAPRDAVDQFHEPAIKLGVGEREGEKKSGPVLKQAREECYRVNQNFFVVVVSLEMASSE